ncbi:MAG: hypothetical protein ABI559_08965 [Chloroflexota bacterium]
MKTARLDPCQQVIKEYEEAFEAYLAVAPAARCRADGVRIKLEIVDIKALQKAQDRLAKAERELLELDAA